jgi:hypothetical protein
MNQIEKLGYFPEYVRIIKDRSTGIIHGIVIHKINLYALRDFKRNSGYKI